MVRSLWNATEQADAAVREWSRKSIVDAMVRLNRPVTSKLRLAAAIPPAQPRLFSEEGEFEQAPCAEAESSYSAPSRPRLPVPRLRIYAKALANQALKSIPNSGGFSDLDAYREHLAATLPFNSRETQRRDASYLISRYFPGECSNSDLPRFPAAMKETPGRWDRPGSDADLLDWLRQCRRAGLYEQGKAIYEKGGLNLANLSDEQQIEAEDDYRICDGRGSSEASKPKKRPRKMKMEDEG